MKLKLKRCNDAEVAASSANCPEKVRILRRACFHMLPLGIYQVSRNQVVAAQAMLTHQPANAASQGQPANAGGRDHAAGCRQLVLLCLRIKFSPLHAALRDYGLP